MATSDNRWPARNWFLSADPRYGLYIFSLAVKPIWDNLAPYSGVGTSESGCHLLQSVLTVSSRTGRIISAGSVRNRRLIAGCSMHVRSPIRSLLRLSLVICTLFIGSATTAPASRSGNESLSALQEVRIRKLHLVRPDLIMYPLYYEVVC